MNREIKFRGKRIDTGEWVYGNLLQDSGLCFIVKNIEELTEKPFNECLVDADTVGQYTGLKDRDMNEIYEGDLLLSVEMVWEVVYDENLASFVLCTEYGRGSTPLGEMIRPFDFKISGNIHDNPELLEDGK